MDWPFDVGGSCTAVTAKSESKEIYLKIGDTETTVNGSKVLIDVPAEITGSRTFVPLRFVSENLGATVLWDGTKRTVSIDYKVTSNVKPGAGDTILEPGDEEIPASSGKKTEYGIGDVFDNGDFQIVINKVEFTSEEKKFHIYGKANVNGKRVVLNVFDASGTGRMADFISFGNEEGMSSFEAVVDTRSTTYYPESIIIKVPDQTGNKMVKIASVDL